MTTPAWKDWPEDCPECGSALEVLSGDPRDGWATDGDPVRCTECPAIGYISCDPEDNCYAVVPDPNIS
jgi:hypothetical protein